MVPRTGFEPVTQEFSVLCSTVGATVALLCDVSSFLQHGIDLVKFIIA